MTKILVLGGTDFAGRAVAEAAVARGWEVTVFHRGSGPAPEGVAALHGDRLADGGLKELAEAADDWDAVIDTWSAAPRVVRDSARLLKERVRRYVYVSSISVHTWPIPAGHDESAPVVDGDPDADTTDYAADKRGAELAVLREFGEERSVLGRAGLILGPYENVGRLPWWLGRMARGGPVLAPGPRELPLSLIDVRDMAEWLLDAAVRDDVSGAYNLVSPKGHTTTEEFLDAVVRTSGAPDVELRWLTPEQIEAAGIGAWVELPVWTPPGEMHDAMHDADVSRALAAGLRCRPVAETVADTWAWLESVGGTAPRRSDRNAKGLDPAKEAAALGL
ncbi:NAD-dependent epimerase/dehydratase family protein [Streptomyces sp. NPDC060194]|uniref:NAD-dependent epimerase/dehydratase family protein n=1 Tax=Streptomyces sp. NPDC060194 TaxID=3347069 RepID=UPI00366383D7